MGYMRHHAIVVTTYDGLRAADAHDKALDFCKQASGILVSRVNDYFSFFVPPDGSKEGWSESDDGDVHRSAFIEWLDSQRFSDGSSPFDWAEVQYGDENRETLVTRHSDEEARRKPADGNESE